MSQANGGIDPLIHGLGQRFLPIEDMAFWREFQRKWPPAAASIWNNAEFAIEQMLKSVQKKETK